jgi:hypothetical protein
MKFAKIVFWIAGALGLLASVGLYFEAGSYVYYGLIAGVLSWQVVFFLIAWDPQRYRPVMIPAMLEKLIWVVTLGYLHLRGQVTASQLASGVIPHGLLGLLFVIAFLRTPQRQTS